VTEQLALSGAAKPRALSSEMSSLLTAMAAVQQGELPGLSKGLPVKHIGGGWWQVEGARRCWQTVTIRALLRRGRLQRAGARTMVLVLASDRTPPASRQPLTEG